MQRGRTDPAGFAGGNGAIHATAFATDTCSVALHVAGGTAAWLGASDSRWILKYSVRNCEARAILKQPSDFVLHSPRHASGTRLGDAGADAFTTMRLMGHLTVKVSQRYMHPSPEAVEELAFGRMEQLSEARAAAYGASVKLQ